MPRHDAGYREVTTLAGESRQEGSRRKRRLSEAERDEETRNRVLAGLSKTRPAVAAIAGWSETCSGADSCRTRDRIVRLQAFRIYPTWSRTWSGRE